MRRANLWGALLLGCVLTARGLAQDPDPVEELGNCRNVNLEGRLIRNVGVATPFDSLHLKFLQNITSSLKDRLAVKSGSVYRNVDANAAIEQIKGDELAPPSNFGFPVSGSVVMLRVSQCVEENGRPTVDLDFYFIPARVPTFWASTKESRAEDATDAAHASGVAPRKFWLTPQVGYSTSARMFGGVLIKMERPSGLFDSFTLDAAASQQVQIFSGAVTDSYEPGRAWIKQATFSSGYQHRDEPAGQDRLRIQQGFFEWKAASSPVGGRVVFRYGAALEGGKDRSSDLSTGTERAQLIRLKAFGGVTLRSRHQTFAASYGILNANVVNAGQLSDFRKHLVDVSQGLSFTPNHYPMEFDFRFNAGRIENLCRQAGCNVPRAERFFGGNVERNFLSDSSWVIRNQPFLRSVPLNSLSVNGAGAGGGGGDQFWAFNATVALGVARKTLIPEDLLKQDGFLRRIDVTTKTAVELLASAYAAMDNAIMTDPGIQTAVEEILPQIRTELDLATVAWEGRADSIPTTQRDDFDICGDDHLSQVSLDLDDVVMKAKPITLLSNSSGNLAETIRCFRRFSAPGDGLAASADKFETLRKAIDSAVARTEVYARAKKQAETDIAVADNTIHTLFYEANVLSFSPTVLFDAAAIGPAASGSSSIRYGLGGGGRFTILSTLRLTLGYAVNLRRQPDEKRGAIFGSMEILDIWGR